MDDNNKTTKVKKNYYYGLGQLRCRLKYLIKNCGEDIETLNKKLDEIDYIEDKITYCEAVQLSNKLKKMGVSDIPAVPLLKPKTLFNLEVDD